jgi:hypothetical protein
MKLRISHVIVQPVLVWDDGEELTPGPQTAPANLPVSALDGLAERLRTEIAEQESTILAQHQGK